MMHATLVALFAIVRLKLTPIATAAAKKTMAKQKHQTQHPNNWALFYIVLAQICPIRMLLLSPPNTVLQMMATLSVPITELPPLRRIGFDWGFQMNHVMPSTVSAFYNAPIWPLTSNRTRRLVKRANGTRRGYRRDFTLMEFYKGFESILKSRGYHGTCLVRSICELTQQPFEQPEQHFISEILSFLMRPSAYKPKLKEDKIFESYLHAERSGLSGLACATAYPACKQNPLEIFSKVEYVF